MQCRDKQGIPFEVKACESADLSLLCEMYDVFSPKGKFQGMPPVTPGACREWIGHLVFVGENYMALREGGAIGHVVVIPDTPAKEGEYLIFVSREERNRGVGSRLTESAVARALELGLHMLWLSVGTYNFPAIALYRKFGFSFRPDDRGESERTMYLKL